jgi:GH15 family glucan-1,4-alpha-glucosidase
MTVRTLLAIGEENSAKRFFKFCSDVLEPDGYLMHKYRADKSIGSSWHAFIHDGKAILPIQEDETALVLVSLWDYYVTTKDIEFIDLHYYGFIKKMALFLAEFIDKDTGLPLPSYDLWEEKHGVSTFTASTVYAGLIAGSNFAELFEKNNTKEMLRSTAERMRLAIIEHLYDDSKGTFIKQISYRNNEVVHDTIVDSSSVYGIITYGVLPVTDKKVIASIQTLRERLQIHDGIGGVPRYERDQYYRQVDTPNPWYITTLWLAQYYIRKAENGDDLGEALRWINWTVEHSPHSGVLSEQLHPFTGEQLSATPLTWSHAEYVYTVQLYHQKLKDLGLCAPH